MREPSSESPPRAAGPDRRERKKQQTREALIRAALELFDAKGYEQTTVREIADAVDVAARTFFRYFASKEELVVRLGEEFSESFLDEVRARPAGEPPFAALHNAFTAVLSTYREDQAASDAASIYLRVVKLIENTPPLLAAYLRNIREQQDVLARTLAEREGVDPATDLRPQLAASVHLTLVGNAVKRALADEEAGIDAILREFGAARSQLESALSGRWATQQ
ncbi:TetR family transcriptional regulator [Actinospica sp. MGRD01-02]|uniref:TetR family transcriptional regulator n=1 Tax=Actinospica acidithermotolerans TaxID=2828514 RepID=A0A941EDT9_9ACTN|nr:TetR family transcriptional regulator [Actinospica acidithermotolerans]MBR7828652.1 TetR family transcriptional regulator [Actinospica acidithermotolerans]